MKQSEKKIFPFSCSKNKLFEMYNYMPLRFVRSEINEIIRENRGLSHTKAIYCHVILHKELEEFVNIHGLPKNYKLSENDSN